MSDQPPGSAYVAWAKAIPSVRCAAAAIRPWTHASEKTAVVVTKTDHFADAAFDRPSPVGTTTVASSASTYYYAAAVLPARKGVLIHAGSEAEEWSFTALLAGAGKPPHALATLSYVPRAGHVLALGSTRASVERVLGPAKSTASCGFEVTRYEPRVPSISVAEMWFIYRDGTVVAIARYEAV